MWVYLWVSVFGFARGYVIFFYVFCIYCDLWDILVMCRSDLRIFWLRGFTLLHSYLLFNFSQLSIEAIELELSLFENYFSQKGFRYWWLGFRRIVLSNLHFCEGVIYYLILYIMEHMWLCPLGIDTILLEYSIKLTIDYIYIKARLLKSVHSW